MAHTHSPVAPGAPPLSARPIQRGLEIAAWSLIAVGVLSRLLRYLLNRPLWADESLVAMAVLERSFAELWTPGPDDPVTPIGFLLLTKAVSWILGEGE